MARPSLAHQRREDLLPVIASTFGKMGYRRTTTAGLARACRVQETQLYRLWPSKKAMFLAVLNDLYKLETDGWKRLLAEGDVDRGVASILSTEARTRGESALHRITLSALSESDDPEITDAVVRMYKQFHQFIRDILQRYHARAPVDDADPLDPSLAAWALIGLGTITNIGRAFNLFSRPTQKKLILAAGSKLTGATGETLDS